MSDDVKLTRSEELKLKERIDLAEGGHDILEKKRDGLIHEFMEIAGEARELNKELTDLYVQSRLKLKLAKVYDGEGPIKSAALPIKKSPKVTSSTKNIMGVLVPEIEAVSDVQRNIMDREYGFTSSTSRIDSVADKYEELLDKIIKAAETQTRILKLLEEIKKTKRRVNALEHKVIPEMKQDLDTVSQALEESEREETFRMKKVKSMASQD